MNSYQKIFVFQYICTDCQNSNTKKIDRNISYKNLKCNKCKQTNIVDPNQIKSILSWNCDCTDEEKILISTTGSDNFFSELKDLFQTHFKDNPENIPSNLMKVGYSHIEKMLCACE